MTEFDSLYKSYAQDVYRFALFLSGNPDDAEDITAETFARVMTAQIRMEQATAKGYFIVCAKNIYLEWQRKHKEKATSKEELLVTQPLGQQYENKQELRALLAFLQTLNINERTALLMSADGIRLKEIATTLELSLSAVKVMIHRQRQKLNQWREQQ